MLIEGIGAILLSLRFLLDFGFIKSIWLGIFNSISAFNNAGFSVFETGLMGYKDDVFINLIITTIIIIGGLGYFVLLEIYYKATHQRKKLSTHTKLVLIMTGVLIVITFLSVFLLEYKNPKSIGDLSLWQKILASYFTSINYITSGFNTLDLSLFQDSSLCFGSIFMAIGGAPGRTAGGIKVTTLAILLICAYKVLRNSNEVTILNKKKNKKQLQNHLQL